MKHHRLIVACVVRLTARESDSAHLDLHGLSTTEAVHVLSTTLSKREAGMCQYQQ